MFFLKALFYASVSFAQFANYNSIILGDRAAGMGGAGTALVEDTSSAAFYNPASLAQSQGSAFSAAAGIYKKYDTQYGSESDYTKTPLKVSTGYFRSLPASTGNLIRREGWTFGLSIVVPEYETFKGDLNSTTDNTSTVAFTDESLWVGVALAKSLSETQSWGVTLYYTARNFTRSIQDRSYPSGSQAILFNSEETLSENALVPVFGYFHKMDSDWNVGASFRPRGIPVASQATYFESLTNTSPYSSNQINETDLSSTVFIPAKLSLGVSATVWGDMLISVSGDLYEGFSYEALSFDGRGSFIVRQATANISVGVEKRFFDWLKLRVGAFSNLSPYPNPDPQLKKHQGERVDQAGFSANVVFIADNKIGYTFGGYYTGGRGRAMERVNQDYTVLTKSQHVFTMLAGTQFYF